MPKRPHKTVLFLCTGNYYRSRFSEILFNHVAGKFGLSWKASSRGLLRFLAATRSKEDGTNWPPINGVVQFCYAAALAAKLRREQEMQDCLEKAMVAARRCRVEGAEDRVSELGDRLRGRDSR